MKLHQLAAEPQLIKLIIDDADIIETYGEEIEFYTWDRQPIDLFMKLAAIDQAKIDEMFHIIKTLILNEDETEVLTDKKILPNTVLLKVISKIVETLGKS